MERFIHYLTYGTHVTFDDPVVLFREQEWATRDRDLAQLGWLVRERGESLRFFFRCPSKWRFIQEVPWEKRPNPDGKVESIPSLLIRFCDSCVPSPPDVDAPRATLSQRFAFYNPQGPSHPNEPSYPS
jgi:hypothetical protein